MEKGRTIVLDAAKGVVSFISEKSAKIGEKKKRWYIILNEGIEGDWEEKRQTIIDAARKLGIYWSHVISGAGDVSAVGAYCNFEKLQKLLDELGRDVNDVGLANTAEAVLFEHNKRK